MDETSRRQALQDVSEDALGFGVAELVTARDLLIRPRAVLTAWMEEGPTGGGRYARPLRLYLALNAVLMLVLFLRGGMEHLFADIPPEILDQVVARSGKSRDAFIADADGWISLIVVPISAVVYTIVATPLLRLWDPETLGWRRGFRAVFAWLCAWTLPMLPFAWWSYDRENALWSGAVIYLLGLAAFLRMGRNRWFRTTLGGVVKALVLALAVQLATALAMIPVIGVGLAAGLWAP